MEAKTRKRRQDAMGVYVTNLFLGRCNRSLFTLDRQQRKTQIPPVQLGKLMGFIGITYRSIEDELFTGP